MNAKIKVGSSFKWELEYDKSGDFAPPGTFSPVYTIKELKADGFFTYIDESGDEVENNISDDGFTLV
jgi:hypothetical protein